MDPMEQEGILHQLRKPKLKKGAAETAKAETQAVADKKAVKKAASAKKKAAAKAGKANVAVLANGMSPLDL